MISIFAGNWPAAHLFVFTASKIKLADATFRRGGVLNLRRGLRNLFARDAEIYVIVINSPCIYIYICIPTYKLV